MKLIKLSMILFLLSAIVGTAAAQEKSTMKNETAEQEKPETENNATFRDDSTDASMGMTGLGSTPGTATTSGAGGTGTNESTGGNTSSDIYTIERRDSVKNASDSISSKGVEQQNQSSKRSR